MYKKMPASFTFFVDKASEKVLQTTYGIVENTWYTLVEVDVLNDDPHANSGLKHHQVIGSMIIEKQTVIASHDNVWAEFNYAIVFNEGNPMNLPAGDVLALSFSFFNQTTTSENPSEIIPAGETSVTLTGGVDSNQCSGEFLNQFGYCEKVKDETTSFRKYSVFFPQLVASYTNVFNSLPQPSVAPLA
jgi:hypothetical protein